jgi:hypothetical protein
MVTTVQEVDFGQDSAGVVQPTSGDILVRGLLVTGLSSARS